MTVNNEEHMNQIKQHPEEFKKALEVLTEEMVLYKEGIVDGTIQLTPEAVIRLQNAIKELSDQTSITLDDITYHTEQLREVRLDMVQGQKGGGANGTTHN